MGSEWSNVGMPLLFKIAKIDIPLQPGVVDYAMPSNVIAPLDAYIRQYQLGTAQNFAAVFTAIAGDTLVTVTQAAHGFGAGSMVFFGTAIAASGQVIQGTYLVTDVVDFDNYQIAVPTPMDGTNSVALPVFSTTAGSSTAQIVLANHGLSVGQSFYCNVPVTVGGLTISGQLIVTGVTDQNTFTFGLGQGASSTASATMNSGLAQAQPSAPGVDPIDFILYPISRTEYASQPDKGPNNQFRPTTFWFQRLRNPVISFWNPPDAATAYTFSLWAMIQPEDAVIEGGTGVDVPYRYLEAYASGLAAKLARKYPPPPTSGVTVKDLRDEAAAALLAALGEDIERVPLFLAGGMQAYYR